MNDKMTPERDQLVGLLNYWQCRKWKGEYDAVSADIGKADFTAKDELFRLARFALLSDTEQFFALLPNVLKAEKLTTEQLRTWPIFREIRVAPEFAPFACSATADAAEEVADDPLLTGHVETSIQ